MRRLSVLFLTLSTSLGSLWLNATASAQPKPDVTPQPVEIVYVEPSNPAYRPVYDRLRKRQVLEQLREFLSPLNLPRRLTVKTEQCDAPSRPYRPDGPVTICYEHVHSVERLATKLQSPDSPPREVMMVGAFVQGMLHNVSHALFDILELPVWGRASDAADQLAAFVMLQFGKQIALKTILGSAWFFEASGRTWTGSDFADVGSPEAQRAYNILCIAYGGDRASFQFLVDKQLLPSSRAERCSGEHHEVRFAFMSQILPHVDQDKMRKVQAMEILMPEDSRQAARQPRGKRTVGKRVARRDGSNR